MSDENGASTLRQIEHLIGTLMTTAMDMIATVVEDPSSSLENYERLMSVVEAESPVLLLAVLRAAAGLAYVADMSPQEIRLMGSPHLTNPATTG